MRDDGVPNFPDPDSSGNVPKADPGQLGVSSSQLQAAQQPARTGTRAAGGSRQQQEQRCYEFGNCPQAVVQQMLSAERRYARCMRSNEVPNWPDPTTISRGVPGFVISVSKDGINPRSAQIRPADQECERLTGSPAPRDVSP
jgi:hypothetical protein